MQSLDLTDDQAERLFRILERQRLFIERLHVRCLELGYPEQDQLRREARRGVLAYSQLCLAANEGRRKGVYRRYLRRARAWPAV